MGTDPTRPTPPPAPALPPPEALAPVAAPSETLVVSGGWQIKGLPDIVLRAGPQAAERTVEFFTAQIRNPHTRAAYGTAGIAPPRSNSIWPPSAACAIGW